MKTLRTVITLSFCLTVILVKGQDPLRFRKDIDAIGEKEYCLSANNKVVVFTGSSSIAGWKDVQAYFPEIVAINNGFGGSQMNELLYYYKEVIIDFHPDIVFIYEGDNDIGSKKKPNSILKTAKKLVKKLKIEDPNLKIVFISTKPSLFRWNLKEQYLELNQKEFLEALPRGKEESLKT